MAKIQFDGVIEAVHYKPNGEVDWVRAYQRRGATFSDYVLVKREALVEALKQGKRYMAGKRIRFKASTFEVSGPLKVIPAGGKDVLVVGETHTERDHLAGVPVI